ncbi:hypothetical protein Ddc_04777 [Ditylenchus destructor]|nr:hypothetical protein Ddc_04777 [Ditylenchus destructor]
MSRDFKGDVRDPWAWRNTWTGEIRSDYAELWIVIPLIVGFLFLAFAMVLPLFIYKYCRQACPCQKCCEFFERFLAVLHQIGREKDLGRRRGRKRTVATSFENPAFDPLSVSNIPQYSSKQIQCSKSNGPIQGPSQKNRINTRALQRRHKSMREQMIDKRWRARNPIRKYVSRSNSCPSKPPLVPRIKL